MYKLLLCLRYLRTRYIALASIISVMLGVATMIVVNSVMSGFSTEMRERIHGILADVVVETHSLDGVPDPQHQMNVIENVAGEYIEAMAPTVEIYGMMSFQYPADHWITRPVTLIGIDPTRKSKVGPLIEYLDSYNPVTEDKRIIRAALRDANTAPGWELTKQAQKHRRSWKNRQLAIHAHQQHESTQFDSDDARGSQHPTPPAFEEPPFDREASAENAPATESVEPAFVEAGDSPRETDSTPQPAVQDPFGPGNVADAAALTDTARPLRARLYVGHGLISYMQEDPETGKNVVRMMVQPGDDVKISTVSASRPPEPRNFNATVVDTLKTGMSEYDSNLVFCNLEYLQEARGMIDPEDGTRAITSIQIKLKDFSTSREVVSRLQAAFPPGVFTVRTWEQKQGPLLAAVEVEAAILNVLLFLIIAVAGFGILAIFFMIVVEKTRDIGILKALGASSSGVMQIFLSYGLALGIVGSGVGVVLGLLFVRYINVIESWITWMTGRKVFDEKIYYFPEIPTSVQPAMVIWVALGAMVIAVLASVLPARRASRLHPVESLRYE